jgi:hypothetical protein
MVCIIFSFDLSWEVVYHKKREKEREIVADSAKPAPQGEAA